MSRQDDPKEETDGGSEACFREVRPRTSVEQRRPPDRIQVYVCQVQAQQCSQLVKELGARGKPESLAHLKRVQRRSSCSNNVIVENKDTESPAKKKCKPSVVSSLQVLLGEVNCNNDELSFLNTLQQKYSTRLERIMVPGRSADSTEELEEFNLIWPTLYFHNKSIEHQNKELELSDEERKQMHHGMVCAIQDAMSANEYHLQEKSSLSTDYYYTGGAVIVSPATGKVVSWACEERKAQSKSVHNNPLQTSAMFCIQGVSRKERQAAAQHGMDSPKFTNGQYLCTGFDLYATRELGVMEAMACVHSRIRRVIWGIPNPIDGGLGGTEITVQSLPTNHQYRTFCCIEGTDLYQKCKELHNHHP